MAIGGTLFVGEGTGLPALQPDDRPIDPMVTCGPGGILGERILREMWMRRDARVLLISAGLLAGATISAGAQQSQPPTPLAVGTTAPDFALLGATRYGVLRDSVRLRDFNGRTVVLAFFFRARTRG